VDRAAVLVLSVVDDDNVFGLAYLDAVARFRGVASAAAEIPAPNAWKTYRLKVTPSVRRAIGSPVRPVIEARILASGDT
jgi:hypothetical protein